MTKVLKQKNHIFFSQWKRDRSFRRRQSPETRRDAKRIEGYRERAGEAVRLVADRS